MLRKADSPPSFQNYPVLRTRRLSHADACAIALGLAFSNPIHSCSWCPTRPARGQQLLQQEQQRELERRLQPLPSDETLGTQIILQGDRADKFQWALATANYAGKQLDNPIGRSLEVKGITLVANRMQNVIIQRGFITTRVVVSSVQDLTSGVLALTIIPGRISKLPFIPTLTAGKTTRMLSLPSQAIYSIYVTFWAGPRKLQVPSNRQRHLPNSPVKQPYGQKGENDVIIIWQQKRPLRLAAFFNDGGSKPNGEYRMDSSIFWDGLFGLNVLLYFNLGRNCCGGDPGKRGNHGLSLRYSPPYGYQISRSSANNIALTNFLKFRMPITIIKLFN